LPRRYASASRKEKDIRTAESCQALPRDSIPVFGVDGCVPATCRCPARELAENEHTRLQTSNAWLLSIDDAEKALAEYADYISAQYPK